MNGYGNSVFLRTAFEVSSGVPPVNTVAPVISGTQVVGSTLTSTTGTWTGSATITYTYQWFRGATLIGGATASTYVLVQADAGNTSNITCQVTGTNAFGNATATSNTLAQIFDFDANAFITSATITDTTQKAATNSLTIDLKGYGIWTKGKAFYPFVGGTSTTHKFNLKNPLDTDAAFRLVFSGGWTHSSNGALPNGTNGIANTFLNDNTVNTLNNVHISVYSRTNTTTQSADISSYDGTNLTSIYPYLANAIYTMAHQTAISAVTPFVNSLGLFIANRTNSTQLFTFKNTTKYTSAFNSVAKSNQNFTLSRASAILGNYSDRQLAFASIGDGLTDTEAANFYTAIQAFQTTLGRQV